MWGSKQTDCESGNGAEKKKAKYMEAKKFCGNVCKYRDDRYIPVGTVKSGLNRRKAEFRETLERGMEELLTDKNHIFLFRRRLYGYRI